MKDLDIQSEPLDEQDQQYIAAAQAGSTATQPGPTSGGEDYIEELQKLAGLRDAGIITGEEFEAKKQQLLGL